MSSLQNEISFEHKETEPEFDQTITNIIISMMMKTIINPLNQITKMKIIMELIMENQFNYLIKLD